MDNISVFFKRKACDIMVICLAGLQGLQEVIKRLFPFIILNPLYSLITNIVIEMIFERNRAWFFLPGYSRPSTATSSRRS